MPSDCVDFPMLQAGECVEYRDRDGSGECVDLKAYAAYMLHLGVGQVMLLSAKTRHQSHSDEAARGAAR